MNDSARGAGLEIPLDTFYDSWRDSDFRMVVTDPMASGRTGALPPAAATTAGPSRGFAALAMTLHPQMGT